ncbi:MAG TPA: hypothetical protein DCQ04_10965 [Actinobacteria bacterium]|jgi:hypothetical protein|nr:hypothetical protein [Actinomycetota bacterium]
MSAPPAWLADPTGRHQMRYWDGQQWTDYVSDAGAQSTDPVGSPGTSPAAQKSTGGSWMDKVTSAANQAVDATSAAVDSAADSLSSKPNPAPAQAQPVAAAAPAAAVAPVAAAAPVTPDPSNLIADELTKLAALRDSGVLTDEEFATQKAKLLGN